MLGNFNIPSVDHLREGIDYRVVEWDFASGNPVPQPAPGEPCPPGTKMIFGLCRRVNEKGEQQAGDDSDQERTVREEAKKQGSSFESNKQVSVGGKKYGWAKKNGKDILVEWGSVAGTKPKPKTAGAAPAAAPAAAAPAAPTTPTFVNV